MTITTTVKKRVTVSQLKQQLEWFETMGHGNYVIEYINNNSIKYSMNIGAHVVDDDNKTVILG